MELAWSSDHTWLIRKGCGLIMCFSSMVHPAGVHACYARHDACCACYVCYAWYDVLQTTGTTNHTTAQAAPFHWQSGSMAPSPIFSTNIKRHNIPVSCSVPVCEAACCKHSTPKQPLACTFCNYKLGQDRPALPPVALSILAYINGLPLGFAMSFS